MFISSSYEFDANFPLAILILWPKCLQIILSTHFETWLKANVTKLTHGGRERVWGGDTVSFASSVTKIETCVSCHSEFINHLWAPCDSPDANDKCHAPHLPPGAGPEPGHKWSQAINTNQLIISIIVINKTAANRDTGKGKLEPTWSWNKMFVLWWIWIYNSFQYITIWVRKAQTHQEGRITYWCIYVW